MYTDLSVGIRQVFFSLLFFLSERQKSFTFIGIRMQRFKITFDVYNVITYYVHDVTFFY